MRTRRSGLTLCVALTCALTMTGCELLRPSMDVDYDDAKINDGLKNVRDRGGSVPLRDFTSWSWDEVHLFHEYTPRDFIEETVGAPVIGTSFFESKAGLLVFEDRGKPVKAIGVVADYLRGADERVTFPGDAAVELRGGAMLLTAPGG